MIFSVLLNKLPLNKITQYILINVSKFDKYTLNLLFYMLDRAQLDKIIITKTLINISKTNNNIHTLGDLNSLLINFQEENLKNLKFYN